VTPFLNGFAKEQDVINAKKQIGGCLKTFFVHGKLKITNWCKAKRHQKLLVGKLANVIWGENWDA